MKFRPSLTRFFCVTSIFLALMAGTVSAATYVVTKTADTNDNICNADCSLREAVEKANQTGAADTVTFDPAIFSGVNLISLNLGQIIIGNDLTIEGPGARLLTINQSALDERIFGTGSIISTGRISGLRFTGGNSTASGGALLFESLTNWTLVGVAVENSSAASGGAIYNEGNLTISESLISGNTSAGSGGCIDSAIGTLNISNTTIVSCTASNGGGVYLSSGTIVLNNVTISSNQSGTAGGIRAVGGTVRMRNTIVSDNNCTACGSDENDDVLGVGRFVSNGNNLIKATPVAGTGFTNGVLGDKVGVNPLLLAIANNGGPTNTQSFQSTSPALDAGNNCVVNSTCPADGPSVALTYDQRGTGFNRLVGANVDIGAFELFEPTAAQVVVSGMVVDVWGRSVSGASVTLSGFEGRSITTRTNPFGYFVFDGVDGGQTYVISVTSKGMTYEPQLISVEDSIDDIVIMASGNSWRKR